MEYRIRRREAHSAHTFPSPSASPSEASIDNGRKLYVKYDCRACHGDNGEGDGQESIAGHLRDADNLPIRSTNLTAPSSWKNGASSQDLFRTLMTGLDGTPMPSHANEFAGQEEELWIWSGTSNRYLTTRGDNSRSCEQPTEHV